MKYLKKLKHADDLGWLDLATSSRKREVSSLKFMKPEIKKRYKSYDSEISKFTECPSGTDFPCDDDKELLIDFYEHAPKKLNDEIIKRRTKHELKDCPFCGMPLKPLTLDHFIPKSKWPEYSIFPNNLVPQCRECAPIKGEKYFDDGTQKCIFISPIYSDLLEKINLQIKISYENVNHKYDFEISFRVDPKIDKDDEIRLISHIKTLKIKSRIELYCRETVVGLINSCQAKKFNLKMVLLARKEERFVDVNSVRDWQTALYLELLEHVGFFNYLESLMPKAASNKTTKTATKTLNI
jgi:hypothetical protein